MRSKDNGLDMKYHDLARTLDDGEERRREVLSIRGRTMASGSGQFSRTRQAGLEVQRGRQQGARLMAMRLSLSRYREKNLFLKTGRSEVRLVSAIGKDKVLDGEPRC